VNLAGRSGNSARTPTTSTEVVGISDADPERIPSKDFVNSSRPGIQRKRPALAFPSCWCVRTSPVRRKTVVASIRPTGLAGIIRHFPAAARRDDAHDDAFGDNGVDNARAEAPQGSPGSPTPAR
jgi:hypothetical protein